MSLATYIEFVLATLLSPLAAATLLQVDRLYENSKRHPRRWQIATGVLFGIIAILGTELGIETEDAVMNVRDAAPIVAGLVFGPQAGIIAGVIGGVERWFAALWGRGMFTRLSCSVATFLSGVYAAALRVWMFEDKRPRWTVATAVGIVAEVLHLTLVLITNFDQSQKAYVIVRACAVPMITCVGLSVGLSVFVVSLLDHEDVSVRREEVQLSDSIQHAMLYAVAFAFLLTTGLTALLQTRLAATTTRSLLELNIEDVVSDVQNAADNSLLTRARRAAHAVHSVDEVSSARLSELKDTLGVVEISVIDERGIIVESTDKSIVGFDMASGEQSNAFMVLLGGSTKSFVQKFQPRTYIDEALRQYAGVTIEGGFIQVAYDEEQYRNELTEQVRLSISSRRVGESGFLIGLGQGVDAAVGNDAFSHATRAAYEDAMLILQDVLSASEEGKVFETALLGKNYYVMYEQVEGYRIVALLPQDEADFSRNLSILVGCFTEIMVFALLFTNIYFFMRDIVVNGIKQMNKSLAEITAGNLDERVEVRTNTEFAELSDGINDTVDTLKSYISEADARIDRELSYARAIQESALPTTFPPYPSHDDFEVYASMVPAKLVGGDFYDFHLLDDDHLAFLIADVSGKGIPAAMFMMRAKSVITSCVSSGLPVDWAMTSANELLCEGNDANMFVTAWLALVDLSSGHVCAVNAGHNPPALYRHKRAVFESLVTKRNLILGCMDGIPYRMIEFDLEPGDALFLYTDGIVEANNSEQELYGEERMLMALNRLGGCTMRRVCEGVSQSVASFAGDAPQFDDMTMVAFRYNGRGISEEEAGEIIEVESLIPNVDVVTAFIDERLERLGCAPKAQMQIDIAIDELFANICKYAYGEGTGPVRLRIRKLDDRDVVEIWVEDEGVYFDPLKTPAPDLSLSLEERPIGGLGIMMVRKMMDEVTYRRRGDRNVLRFRKSLM